jgi:hypothetical protein
MYMPFQVMSTGSPASESELPWIEDWTEGKGDDALFPRLVRSIKQVKSGKGFLLETDVFLAFCFKKHPRALFIAQYLYDFETSSEAPSLKVLPSKDSPKLWAIGIDDDLAVQHVTLNDWTTEFVPVLVPSPSGKLVTKAYTPPDSQSNLPFRDDSEQQPAAVPKRSRKPPKNEPQDG